MAYYEKLKIGKYDLPTWDALIPLVLTVGQQNKVWKLKEFREAVIVALELPSSLKNKKYAGSKAHNETVIQDRVSWAFSILSIAGLLVRPKRATFSVTKLGMELLNKYGLALDATIIQKQPMCINHKNELKERNENNKPAFELNDGDSGDQDFIESIDRCSQQYNNEAATNLLARIREAQPAFFESLVVELLSKMGYKGPNGNASVTQLTNDGGIDGIINQDPLGTSTVYIQAKRYQADNVVQRPAIDAFYGTLSRRHADRGVFITTSSFSSGAKETAKGFSIVLIDGIRLTDLMLQYRVGVEVKRTFTLFQIDEDFFEEN
ncbi:MAG: restriction endonuclease [Lactobacillus sp.]|jgi:restriction system protein|nr:restriction endonuclease [Lactobacillus sp.]